MKKIFAMLMALIMVLSLAACGNDEHEPSSGSIPKPEENTEPEETPDETKYHDSYYELVEDIKSEGMLGGCAHIIYTDGYEDMGYEFMFEVNGYSEKYPFVYDIPEERYLDLGGPDMFCIVPIPGSKVEVREFDIFAETAEPGELIYSDESGEPFMILCNQDGNPDAEVILTTPEGKTLTFHPYYLAEIFDGENWGYDFTIYETYGEDGYDALIDTLAWAECYAGVGYIGYVEGPMGDGYGEMFEAAGYTEMYPFISDIPSERFVETAGYELYLIVPASLDYSVEIVEVSLPENTEAWGHIEGDTIYESETGEPFLLLCNESEIFTNVLVKIYTPDGTEKRIAPYLSGKDGSLCGISDDGLSAMDITPITDENLDFMSFDEMVGEWMCDFYPDGVYEYTVGLEFFYNEYGQQCVNFWYGPYASEMDEHYTGTVYEDYDINGDWTGGYILDMYLDGGLFYNGTNSGLECTYKFQMSPTGADAMYAIHYGEKYPFFSGYEYEWFEFYQPKG